VSKEPGAVQAERRLESQRPYHLARQGIAEALTELRNAAHRLAEAQDHAYGMLEEIEPPGLILPTARITTPAPAPLFSTDDDYATATLKLKAWKGLEDES
jgi:hypothetical protein